MATPDLMQALRDVFLREYAKFDPVGMADDRLNFEIFPRPLDPSECLFNKDDPGSKFMPEKLQEMMSNLVVDLPSLVDNHTRKSGDEDLGDAYEYALVNAAVFRTDPVADPTVEADAYTRFAGLQHQATMRIEAARHPSAFSPTLAQIVTSELSPPDFLDPQKNDLWLDYPAAGDVTPPSVVGGALRWRAIDAKIVEAKLSESGQLPDQTQATLTAPSPKPAFGAAKKKFWLHAFKPEGKVVATTASPTIPLGKHTTGHLQAGTFSKITADDMYQLIVKPKLFDRAQVKASAKAAQLLTQAIVDTPAAVPATTMSIRFRYQIVKIDRPWILWPFLEHPNWYVHDQHAGAYSNPDDTEAPGSLRWIPKALVVIRDLKIVANWRESDRAEFDKAFAIGPFGTGTKAEFVGQELRVDGVQLLACIDRPMPLLPPKSDPKLEATP